jgi:fatty-acid desaturase
MSLCQYKDALGKPNEGFHKERLFGMARNDLLGTVAISILIGLLMDKNIFLVFIVIFLLGVLLHLLFCVDTAFIKYLKKIIY